MRGWERPLRRRRRCSKWRTRKNTDPTDKRSWVTLSPEIKKSQTRLRPQPDGSGTDLNFRARVLVHPQIVARGQRTVRHRFQPVALPAGLEGNRALYQADASGASRRILIVALALILILGSCAKADGAMGSSNKIAAASTATENPVRVFIGLSLLRLPGRTIFSVILIKPAAGETSSIGSMG